MTPTSLAAIAPRPPAAIDPSIGIGIRETGTDTMPTTATKTTTPDAATTAVQRPR